MGTNVILDILGSIVIFGILMLTLFRIFDSATANTYKGSGDLVAQQNLSSIIQVLEHDLRKIGYCADWKNIPIPSPNQAILLADSAKIKFLTDVDEDGNLDSLFYYLGPTSELTNTPNPRDRFLYRVTNNESPVGVNLGVIQFKLTYINSLGSQISFPITEPGEVHSMEIQVAVEDIDAYDQQYSTAIWRQVRLAARNLRNR
jgi:hypothetical protein